MKKLLLSLLLVASLFCDDVQIEKEIFESIFSSLSDKAKPLVYSDSEIASLGLKSEKFGQTYSCEKADIVVMTKSSLPSECQKRIVFGTRYRHLRQDYVIGAFFWQKGRPNMLFIKEKLDKHNIILSAPLSEYIE